MSGVPVQSTELEAYSGFSVGICASDTASNLLGLLRTIREETFSPGLVLERIIVVASGCPERILSEVRDMSDADPRIVLLTETQRNGKIEAINEIIRRQSGEFLVLVNSDAVPAKGSIPRLLRTINADEDIGSVSALPTFRSRAGVTQKVLRLMWSAHNVSSSELNHLHLGNHNCDELMAVRSKLISELPNDVVNDGAYIGGLVYSKGYHIAFREDAKVMIDVPSRISDLIQQRRRILFGHAQVWKELGRPPRTIESLLVTRPRMAIHLLGTVISARPNLILVLPVAVITEAAAGLLSIVDRIFSPRRHVVWRRYSEQRNAK